jgi:CBS-domain-containing membrane protein
MTMPILEVMTSGHHGAARDGDRAVDAVRSAWPQRFPVVAGRHTRGIITKLDVLRLLHPDDQFRLPDPQTIAATRVAAIMRPGALTVEVEDPVVVAADLMVATGRRSLPVVKRGSGWPKLVGIVSRGDLLRGLRFELAKDAPRRVARA